MAAPARAADPLETRFDQALADWRDGRADEAREALAAIAAERPDLPGVWFWLARAARDAGDLPEAARAIARCIELEPDSPDAHYLAGLIASESERPTEAIGEFESAIRLAPDGPLAAPARERLADLRWRQDRDRALDLLGARRADEARPLLERLDAARPGDPVVQTALATADLLDGRAETALERLDAVIAGAPDHEEARYWRALALAELGRRPEARAALADLADSADPTVSAAARRTLAAWAEAPAAEPVPRAAPSRAVRSWWSLGGAWDSNPANVSDTTRTSTSPATSGLTAGGRVRWRAWSGDRTRLFVAPGGVLRTYAEDGSLGGAWDYAQAGLAAAVERDAGRWAGWAGARADLAWLGWSPLVDRQAGWVGGRFAVADRLHLRLRLDAFRRTAHQDAYDNLTGTGLSALPEVRVGLGGGWRVDLGLFAGSEDASPYTVGWTTSAGETITVEAEADWRGVGPRVAVRGEPLPDRLELSASALTLTRVYGVAEAAASSTGATREGDREDRHTSAVAAASLRVAPATWLFLRASTVVNDSSLDADTWLIDRDYRRTLVLAGVEARP